MRKEIAISTFLLFALLGLEGCTRTPEAAETASGMEAVADSTTLLLRVRQTSRLYTAEYKVHKIVTHEDVKHLQATLLGRQFDTALPIGERKIAIPIDVTLRAYIDFTNFSDKQVERSEDGRKLHIILPDPKVIVTSSRVDHASTRQFRDLLRSDFTDAEMADYTAQGVQSILRAVPQMGILETARKSAAATLIPLFAQMGYAEEDIVVTFRKEFTERDLPFYFDSEGRR